jgi:hypothetical protein
MPPHGQRASGGAWKYGAAVLGVGAVMFAVWTQIGDRGELPSGSAPAAQTASTSAAPQTTQPSLAELSPDLQPSNENEDLVAGYLESQSAGILGSEGFTQRLHVAFGSLGSESSEEVRIPLPANSDIAIIAVCDNECGDIDLVLFQASGEKVDDDTLADDVPVVQVSTGSSIQEYVVRVGMVTCTIEPCFYSFGIYAR